MTGAETKIDGVKLIRVERQVSPFGQPPSDLPVLGRPLSSWTGGALTSNGLTVLSAEDKPSQPHLVLADDVWLVPEMLTKFIEACPLTGGRLAISREDAFGRMTAPLQGLSGQELMLFDVAIVPKDGVSMDQLPPILIDLEVSLHPTGETHPAFSHAWPDSVPVATTPVHRICHWSHLLRVNQFALMSLGLERKRRFDSSPWFLKLVEFLKLLISARSINKFRLARSLSIVGKGCSIHPTAVVELSVLGDGVEIGPHALVRGSWLGDGVKIAEHARINLTVADAGAEFGRGVMSSLMLLMKRAFISQGLGFQAGVIGERSFVAMGACFYDLSFGGEIKVNHNGERVSSGTHFLGSCLGHDVKIGPNVTIGYGEEVPNGAFIVASPDIVMRRIPKDLTPGVPHYCVNGEATPVQDSGGGLDAAGD